LGKKLEIVGKLAIWLEDEYNPSEGTNEERK